MCRRFNSASAQCRKPRPRKVVDAPARRRRERGSHAPPSREELTVGGDTPMGHSRRRVPRNRAPHRPIGTRRRGDSARLCRPDPLDGQRLDRGHRFAEDGQRQGQAGHRGPVVQTGKIHRTAQKKAAVFALHGEFQELDAVEGRLQRMRRAGTCLSVSSRMIAGTDVSPAARAAASLR